MSRPAVRAQPPATTAGGVEPPPRARRAMPQDSPRISIIIAVLNGAGVLGRCLDSIAAQTWRDYEVLVADGGSTDGTLDILHARAAELAYWKTGPDDGVYGAWNTLLGRARGQWLCFLGADDRFHADDVLARVVPVLETTTARVVYGVLHVVGADGGLLESLERPWPAIRPAFLAGLVMLPHTGSFHHRRLFDEHGPFEPSFRIAGDYDAMLRELRQRDAAYLEGLVTVDMQIGGLSGKPENLRLGLDEIARARSRNGVTAWSPRLGLRRAMARFGVTVYRFAGPRALRWLTDAFRLLTFRRRKWTR